MNKAVSPKTHAIIGYLVGIVLFFAPNIFGFNDNGGAAVAIPRIVAIVLLISELTSANGLSLLGVISMRAHVIMDVVAGLFLAVSPWLFGFYNQGSNAWLPHLIAGLMYTGLASITSTQSITSGHTSRRAHA
jgi:hypothetical protein